MSHKRVSRVTNSRHTVCIAKSAYLNTSCTFAYEAQTKPMSHNQVTTLDAPCALQRVHTSRRCTLSHMSHKLYSWVTDKSHTSHKRDTFLVHGKEWKHYDVVCFRMWVLSHIDESQTSHERDMYLVHGKERIHHDVIRTSARFRPRKDVCVRKG